MKLIVDRFEGDYAVCEKDGRIMVNIEREKLPEDVKEGHVLIVEGDSITIDEDATLERRERIRKLMEKLNKNK